MPTTRVITMKPVKTALPILVLTLSLSACSLLQLKLETGTVPLTKEELRMRVMTRDFALVFFNAIENIIKGKLYISPRLTDQSMQNWARLRRGENDSHVDEVLTVRQREILKLIAEGKSNKEIADLLCLSVRTVERHRANIMNKLNIRKTAELVQYALRKHYI